MIGPDEDPDRVIEELTAVAESMAAMDRRCWRCGQSDTLLASTEMDPTLNQAGVPGGNYVTVVYCRQCDADNEHARRLSGFLRDGREDGPDDGPAGDHADGGDEHRS